MKYLSLLLISLPLISVADDSTQKTSEAKYYIQTLCTTLHLFRLDSRRYPTNEEGLIQLLEPMLGDGGVRGQPYLIEIKTDPWGNQYQYFVKNKITKVWSMGPDGLSDSKDDVNIKAC